MARKRTRTPIQDPDLDVEVIDLQPIKKQARALPDKMHAAVASGKDTNMHIQSLKPMVRIKLCENENCNLVFDRNSLVQNSAWFAETLKDKVDEHSRRLASGRQLKPIAAIFRLRWDEAREIWVLYLVPSANTNLIEDKDSNFRSSTQADSMELYKPMDSGKFMKSDDVLRVEESSVPIDHTKPDDSIKSSQLIGLDELSRLDQHMKLAAKVPLTEGQQVPLERETRHIIPISTCQSYKSFLYLLVYNKDPEVNKNGIGTVFEKAFAIMKLAIYYDARTSLRPFLRSSFLDAGKELYMAIKNNPTTWLWNGIELQSSNIFTEAIVHIVGDGIMPVNLPDEFHQLIEKKSQALKSLEAATKIDLLQHVPNVFGVKLKLADSDKGRLRSWSVVHLWRDWFIESLGKFQRHSEAGALYRTISEGRDAYLPLEQVHAILNMRFPEDSKQWRSVDIEADLHRMKKYAQERVKGLVVNNTMVDIKEANVMYLTCTRLEDAETRWW